MYNILAKVIKEGLMLTFYGQNRSKIMSFDTTIQTCIKSFFQTYSCATFYVHFRVTSQRRPFIQIIG